MSSLNWLPNFLSTEFLRSDLIALASFAVAAAAAIYARHQAAAANRANRIATQEARRPSRLAVYQSMLQFAEFCTNYYTRYCLGAVTSSEELKERIDDFILAVEQHGHLSMPPVESLAAEMEKKARLLQREIDRLNQPSVRAASSAEVRIPADHTNLELVIDWFASQRVKVKNAFAPYLAEA